MKIAAGRLQPGDRLHVWMRPAPGAEVPRLTVFVADQGFELSLDGGSRRPLRLDWESPASGEATLEWADDEAEVSVAYAFTPADVAEAGIRILWTSQGAATDPARYRFHAAPPFGWMNDPNGLIEIDGVTHLFYQHNPHGRRWDTMHWGHATSRDGLAWVHQPIALLPREELLREDGGQGGAYSGSALPQPDGTLRVFHTDRDDNRRPTREWQVTAVLNGDGVAGPSTVLLDAHPPVPGFRNDWRDPYVFAGPDGMLKMLLGGADARGSVVLLYETDDPRGAAGWRFAGVMFREAARRVIPAECPSMIRLGDDGLWLLIFSLLGSRDDETHRRNLVQAHVGRFDGRSFASFYKRDLDIGTDSYAMQLWQASDGPRGIAWAANWTDVSTDRDFESAMTLPRRMLWQDGALLTPPIAAVDRLRAGPPTDLTPGRRAPLEDGLGEIGLVTQPGTPFVLTLDHPTHELAIDYDGLALRLRYIPPGNPATPDYRAHCPSLHTVRVFIDVGLIEIYVDDGQMTCTKRVDSALPVAAVHLSFDTQARSACLWPLAARTPTNRANKA